MLTRTLALLAGLALAACGTSTIPLEDAGPGPDTGPPADADVAPDDAGPDMDAGPAPVCDPGATQIGECGFCGSQAQECDSAGQWMGTSECLGEGECAFGTVETRDLAMCAQEQRLCLDGCLWGPWEEITPSGVCEPGESRLNPAACPDGESRGEACSETCVWEVTSTCADPCGGVARTSPEWKREVCVPAGNFVRGSPNFADTQPIVDVYVSSFYVDAYPVTNRRYRECVAAGACRPTNHATYGGGPTFDDYPVQSVWHEWAADFCAWDGRRLPTEAEWEKAARGPAPRTNLFPWGTDTWDCTLVDGYVCGYRAMSSRTRWGEPYDSQPGTVSFYGTFLQLAGVFEWVADYYSSTFYADPSSRTDPQATLVDSDVGTPSIRGWPRGQAGGGGELARRETSSTSGTSFFEQGFRCARSSP